MERQQHWCLGVCASVFVWVFTNQPRCYKHQVLLILWLISVCVSVLLHLSIFSVVTICTRFEQLEAVCVLEPQLLSLHHPDNHLFYQMLAVAVAEYVCTVSGDTPARIIQSVKTAMLELWINPHTLQVISGFLKITLLRVCRKCQEDCLIIFTIKVLDFA